MFVIENSSAFVCDAFPIILTHISREGAFSGLDSLEWLKLEDNAISALAGGDLFPASLKVLNILTLAAINALIKKTTSSPYSEGYLSKYIQRE